MGLRCLEASNCLKETIAFGILYNQDGLDQLEHSPTQKSCTDYGRKFRSLTSDSRDTLKAHQRSQVRRKKINTQVESLEEDTHVPNGRKVANCCVFSMVCGSGCSKSRLAKAAGAEVAAQQRNEKWHAAVA